MWKRTTEAMKLISAFILMGFWISAYAGTTLPAPKGDPKVVAELEIKKAEHPCGTVKTARSNGSGSIYAVCSNSEDYLIFNISTKNGVSTLVMRCSVMPKVGMSRNTCKQST